MRNGNPKLVPPAFWSRLAVLVSFLLCPAFAHALSPIPAVGMEARGVDVWFAWHHSPGLEIRDALNRPVSAALVERQVKTGMSEGNARTAFLSALPSAKKILKIIENLLVRIPALSLPFSSSRGQTFDAWANVMAPMKRWWAVHLAGIAGFARPADASMPPRLISFSRLVHPLLALRC